jgi:AraC-like DNA-binding protein
MAASTLSPELDASEAAGLIPIGLIGNLIIHKRRVRREYNQGNMATNDAIREALKRAARDGKVSCKSLLNLSQRLGASPRLLGRLCNEMRIHIRACQLGCFR